MAQGKPFLKLEQSGSIQLGFHQMLLLVVTQMPFKYKGLLMVSRVFVLFGKKIILSPLPLKIWSFSVRGNHFATQHTLCSRVLPSLVWLTVQIVVPNV